MPAVRSRLEFDSSRHPEMSMRMRSLLVVANFVTLATPVSSLALMSYADGELNPAVPTFAIVLIAATVGSTRARIVIIDGVLWRRVLLHYRPVDLKHLASVQFRRNDLRRQLTITDQAGHSTCLTPAQWSGGRRLVGLVETAARWQLVEFDDRTAHAFETYPSDTAELPLWARRDAPPLEVEWPIATEPRAPRRLQAQRFAAALGAAAVLLPLSLQVSQVGTHAIGTHKCGIARHLWTEAPDFPTDAGDMRFAAVYAAGQAGSGRAGGVFTLDVDQIADKHNTKAVQADSAKMIEGIDVGWNDGRYATADIYFERFASHAEAAQLQRDYGEDHCHRGDPIFAVDSIPGAVGVRCRCTGSIVHDKVTFVRGTVRVMAIVWNVSANDGHDAATSLAMSALDGLEHPAA